METPKTSSDEIDLMELFLKVIFTVKRNFILILSFFLIGTALGFTYGMLGTKVYESKMMVTSYTLTDSYNEKLEETLQDLIDDGNIELVAKRLALTSEEAENVISVEIESAQKEKQLKEDEKRWFLITVKVLKAEMLPKIERGLVSYLENLIKIRVDQKKSYYGQLIKEIDKEILSLENFKTKIYEGDFFETSKGNIMFDPTEVNSKIVELSEAKFKYQNELEVANSVQVVEGFVRFDKSPNKIISLAAGATLGLFFVGILIAFKSIRKVVRMAEEAEKK